jgi:hypothetical protein
MGFRLRCSDFSHNPTGFECPIQLVNMMQRNTDCRRAGERSGSPARVRRGQPTRANLSTLRFWVSPA